MERSISEEENVILFKANSIQSEGQGDDRSFSVHNGYSIHLCNFSMVEEKDVPGAGKVTINRDNLENQGIVKMRTWNIARDVYLWFRSLKEAFGGPFLAVVIIVYGISQGYAGTVRQLATKYYWKDVQKLQPASTEAFQALSSMPWSIKPAYGLITDSFPIAGFQRWPYLAICGIAGACCLWVLSVLSAPSPWLVTLLMAGVALCTAFPDVVVDAAMAEQSRKIPTLASDLQSLSWGSLSVGGFIGCAISGSAVHFLGPRGSFSLISIAPLLLIVAALALPEKRLPKGLDRPRLGAMVRTLKIFGRTLQDPTIWKPALYIYLSQGLCPDISDGMFYWMTNPTVGPGFSEQFLGFVGAISYLAMFVGIAMYNCWFRYYTFRTMFFWPQVAYCAMGLLDLVIVTRTNLKMGIPDHAYVIGDETLTVVIGRLQLIPLMVLSAKLCPPGVEGTVFAFLMSTSNFGAICAGWFGALILKLLHVQRDDYSNLWLAVLIRSCLRLTPLFFLFFLLPEGTADDIETPAAFLSPAEENQDHEAICMLPPPTTSQELAALTPS